VNARALTAVLALTALAACSGCGPGGASAGNTSSPSHGSQTSAASAANATHEYPSPPPPAETVPSAAPTPEQAIRRFTLAYINWNASRVAQDLSRLAQMTVGQARSEMQLEAARASGDYELRRGGIANRGSVESVAPAPIGRGTYVVVTLERTTASASANTEFAGLRPAWHVALATVAPVSGGGWVVSGWQPES